MYKLVCSSVMVKIEENRAIDMCPLQVKDFQRPRCSSPVLIVNRNSVKMMQRGGKFCVYLDANRREYAYCNYTALMMIISGKQKVNSYELGEETFDKYKSNFKALLRFAHGQVQVSNIREQCERNKKVTKTYISELVNKKVSNWESGVKVEYNDEFVERISRFFVLLNGKKQYIYQLVSCGKCELCTQKQDIDFVNRCAWENQSSETKCLFVTLTYDNRNIPYKVDCFGEVKQRGIPSYVLEQYEAFMEGPAKGMPSVMVKNHPIYKMMQSHRGKCDVAEKDIDRFLKRLRINWTRSKDVDYNKDRKLRYCCVREHGSVSNHPHYHLLLWNVPLDVDADTMIGMCNTARIEKDIERAWLFGSIKVEVARDCAKYVSKYVHKMDKNGVRSKLTMSNRGGGLGAHFLKSFSSLYESHPELQTLTYTDKWTGQLVSTPLNGFANKTLFPPLREYTSKYQYIHYYETLQFMYEQYLRDISKKVDSEVFASEKARLLEKLQSVRITENAMFPALPDWEQDVFSYEHDLEIAKEKHRQSMAMRGNDIVKDRKLIDWEKAQRKHLEEFDNIESYRGRYATKEFYINIRGKYDKPLEYYGCIKDGVFVPMSEEEFKVLDVEKQVYRKYNRPKYAYVSVTNVEQYLANCVEKMPKDVDAKLAIRDKHIESVEHDVITDEYIRASSRQAIAMRTSQLEKKYAMDY